MNQDKRVIMLRWFKGRPKRPRTPQVPQDHRVYAVGDIHGRLDLLLELMDKIERDDAARPQAKTHIVFLGDLIDRGPSSAQVVDYLLHCRTGSAIFHFIAGNHEEALLDSVRGPHIGSEGWLSYGGCETLLSYGVGAGAIATGGILLDSEIQASIPADHVDFIAGFNDSVQIGDYLFVHAGIRPSVPLDQQSSHDMRWIREEFLGDESDHGVVVVHGHTISEKPEFRANRIGIDTGAYRTGVLTALGLEGSAQWLLST